MRSILTVLGLSLLLITSGCGGGDGDGAENGAPGRGTDTVIGEGAPGSATGPVGSATKGSGDVTIDMREMQFQPQEVTVRVGEEVTWVNRDTVQHDAVNEQDGEGPRSELLDQGQTYSFGPESAGRIDYVCTIHPGMEGTLNVVE
jgi:plastocyanin